MCNFNKEINMFIEVNAIYRHKKCEIYTVLGITNRYSTNLVDYPRQVVYRRYSDNTVWSRPLEKFTEESFTKILF